MESGPMKSNLDAPQVTPEMRERSERLLAGLVKRGVVKVGDVPPGFTSPCYLRVGSMRRFLKALQEGKSELDAGSEA